MGGSRCAASFQAKVDWPQAGSGQAPQPDQAQHRLRRLARAAQVHLELRHSIVVLRRVHQHLLETVGCPKLAVGVLG